MSQSNQLTIQSFTTATLMDFVQSDAFKILDNYPITVHRALSHAHNPRADKNDPILYLAYDKREILVAYRLLLVDQILVNEHKEKVAWYSCVWVHPEHRGLGIAKKLVSRSLRDWDNKILFQGAVKESKQLYSSTGIFNTRTIKGFRGYLRFNLKEIFEKKFPKFKRGAFLLTPLDKLLNIIHDPDLRYRLNRSKLDHSRIEIIDSIDDQTEQFIRQHQSKNLFKRSKEEYNWILNNPWIKSTRTVDHVSEHYYFSSIAYPFKYICVKFFNQDKELSGFVLLQLRVRHLSVQYAAFRDSELKQVVGFIVHLFKELSVDYFTSYNPHLNRFFDSNKNPFWYQKEILREFQYSKDFEPYFKEDETLHFEAGDGDMIFT